MKRENTEEIYFIFIEISLFATKSFIPCFNRISHNKKINDKIFKSVKLKRRHWNTFKSTGLKSKENWVGLVDRFQFEPVTNQTGSNRTGLITSYKTSFFKK